MATYRPIYKTKELSLFEFTLINMILSYLHDMESCKNLILEHITKEEFTKAKERTDEYNFLKRGRYLNGLLDAFYEHASITSLNKIINEEKFTPESSFLETFLIPKSVLKSFNSYDKVLSNDPKHLIAKKLGATITL